MACWLGVLCLCCMRHPPSRQHGLPAPLPAAPQAVEAALQAPGGEPPPLLYLPPPSGDGTSASEEALLSPGEWHAAFERAILDPQAMLWLVGARPGWAWWSAGVQGLLFECVSLLRWRGSSDGGWHRVQQSGRELPFV